MKTYDEKSNMPRFMLFIFVFQFVLFLVFFIKNNNDRSLLFISFGILIIGVFLYFTKLVLKMDKNGIVYKFLPFTSNMIFWSDVNKIELIKISALSDFTGWGIRYSKKYGKGYITDSEYGLFIEKKNGKKITISIKDKDSVEKFLTDSSLL